MKKDKLETKKVEDLVHTPKKKKQKASKKTILKWVGVSLVVVALVLGGQYYSFVKKAEASRAAQQKQEEILMAHWEDQGLSEEEIQEKLRESRIESFNPDDAPLMFQILRSVRHATGTGPGGGTLEGGQPGAGGGTGPGGGSGAVRGSRTSK